MRKFCFPMLLLFFAAACFAQTSESAVATYSSNDKLISLTNLAGISDCPTRNIKGKVKKIEVNGNSASIRLKAEGKTANITIPLDRVSAEDRAAAFRHLITKKNTLRIAGYSCGPDDTISAFSVDRIY